MPPFASNFAKISWSNLFAQFSEQIALAAAPLAAVLLLGADASATAWLQTSQTLPFLLLSIPAGLIVDRISRRNLMIGAEILRALALLSVLLLLISGQLSLVWLAVFGFAGAVGTVCYSVATPAYIPAIIPKERLMAANRWLEIARSTAFAAGPALGGALVGYMGAPVAFVLAVALSILAFLLLCRLPRESREAAPSRHILQDLSEGAAFVIGHRLLFPVLCTAIVFNISWFVVQGIYVAYASTHLMLDAPGIGLTLGIYGMGMVVGAFFFKRLSDYIPLGILILLGPVCGFLAALLLLATIRAPSGALAAIAFFLFGAGPVIWSITTMSLRQAVTPIAMMGRVSALILTATFGARPVGAALSALIALRFGVEACLWIAAIGFGLQLTIILLSPVRALRELSWQG